MLLFRHVNPAHPLPAPDHARSDAPRDTYDPTSAAPAAKAASRRLIHPQGAAGRCSCSPRPNDPKSYTCPLTPPTPPQTPAAGPRIAGGLCGILGCVPTRRGPQGGAWARLAGWGQLVWGPKLVVTET